MKNKTIAAVIIVCGLLISGNALATGGGKTKPPVAEESVGSSWYESILDYFGW